ncbi:unnamed protein product [Anisakis simplex]|uniref:Solute carrier family 7 member 13 (inferred by orthology to a human protein) n=1 Tax=Anisakis simplex TaxID=6269 RepID=A0A0M3K0M0_ANISI|nr:unnamed protein product [Anisakis simplex]
MHIKKSSKLQDEQSKEVIFIADAIRQHHFNENEIRHHHLKVHAIQHPHFADIQRGTGAGKGEQQDGYPIAFGFMCVGCFVLFPAAISIQSQTFSEYLIRGLGIQICDPTHAYIAKKLIAFALIWLLMFVNFFSLKTFVSRFQIAATISKILITMVVIIVGFYYLFFKGHSSNNLIFSQNRSNDKTSFRETDNLSHPFEGAASKVSVVVPAIFQAFYSFDGWDVLNYGVEEIEKPRRTMPVAIFFGLVGATVIYLAMNLSFFVVLDKYELISSVTVATTFGQQTLGRFQYAIPFLICIVLIGSVNGSIFSASRYLYAAARQGHLPNFIRCTNYENDSPRAALIVCILLSMAMSFAGDIDMLIDVASFAQALQRVCTMYVLLWIRVRHIPVHAEAVRYPIVLPILFAILCFGLIVVQTTKKWLECCIAFAAFFGGVIIFLIFIYQKSLPSIKLYQRVTKTTNDILTKFAQIMLNVLPETCKQEECIVNKRASCSYPADSTDKQKIDDKSACTDTEKRSSIAIVYAPHLQPDDKHNTSLIERFKHTINSAPHQSSKISDSNPNKTKNHFN